MNPVDRTADTALALKQLLFCQHVLSKAGSTVLLETLEGAASVSMWDHYPPNDVFDPESGAQWYYHCHPSGGDGTEHGHFHCFIRPDGAKGPIHHLIAIGIDSYGNLKRLFTVNQWVVGDDWADATVLVDLLDRFDPHFPRPSYLVNRWLSAIIGLYKVEIQTLIQTRHQRLAAHVPSGRMVAVEDRDLEITSELAVDLDVRVP